MALSTTQGYGYQLNGGSNPQSSVSANSVAGGTPDTIQPSASNGINTSSTAKSIPLSATSQGTTQPAVVVAPVRHIHPLLIGFSLVLFIAAIVLFWATSRADKTTTNS